MIYDEFVMGKFGVPTHKSTFGLINVISGILLIVKTIESSAAALQGKFSSPCKRKCDRSLNLYQKNQEYRLVLMLIRNQVEMYHSHW